MHRNIKETVMLNENKRKRERERNSFTGYVECFHKLCRIPKILNHVVYYHITITVTHASPVLISVMEQ
jgi:hypothetical protein